MTQTRFVLPRSAGALLCMDYMDTAAPRAVPVAGGAVAAAAAAAAAAATAHPPRAPPRNPPAKKFHCTECGTSWPSANALTTHSYTHSGERPYACTECDKRFSQSCNLKSHILAVHEKVKFRCMLCLHDFSTATNLSKHIEKTHNKGARVRCSECWAIMRGDLGRHQKTTLCTRTAEGVQRKLQVLAKTKALLEQGRREHRSRAQAAEGCSSAGASTPAPAVGLEDMLGTLRLLAADSAAAKAAAANEYAQHRSSRPPAEKTPCPP